MRVVTRLYIAAAFTSLALAGHAFAAPQADSHAGAEAMKGQSGKSAPAEDAETLASRKALEGFLGMLAKGDARGAIEQYTTDTYTQHMSGVAPGREGVIAHIESELARGAKVTVLGVVAHGNMVGLHMRQTFADGSPEREVIEMWRVENGKLAEHWGIGQLDLAKK